MSKPPRKRGQNCPLCAAPATPEHAPFCTQGCRDRDLLRWLDDGYRIPGRPLDTEDAENGTPGLDSGSDQP